MKILFNTWRPDLAPEVAANEAVLVAENCLHAAAGYEPIGALTACGGTPLDGAVFGSIGNCVAASGGIRNYAGTVAKLWELSTLAGAGDWVDRSGAVYTASPTDHWDFCQYGDDVIAVTYYLVVPQWKQITSAVNFAALATSGTAPSAACCMALGEHLVLGSFNDVTYGVGILRNGIWWSQKGNARTWPTPGTATAIAQQSDYRELTGVGGYVRALVSEGEVGWIFRQKAIHRMQYVGGATMFEITQVEPGQGCVANHLAVPTPPGIIYLDKGGLFLFDRERSYPIGEDKFRRYLASSMNDYEGYNSLVAHPTRTEVWLAVATDSTPADTILVYDWVRDEATVIDDVVEWLADTYRVGPITDSEPDQVLAFDELHDLSSFTGGNMACKLTSGDIEAHPGRKSTCVRARAFINDPDNITMTLRVGTMVRSGAAITWSAPKNINSWADFDCDEDGRFHRFELTLASGLGWDSVTGLEVELVPSGAD